MHQSDCEDEFNLSSLKSLLCRNRTRLSPKSHDTPMHEKSTKSSLQIQGWMEVQGRSNFVRPESVTLSRIQSR